MTMKIAPTRGTEKPKTTSNRRIVSREFLLTCSDLKPGEESALARCERIDRGEIEPTPAEAARNAKWLARANAIMRAPINQGRLRVARAQNAQRARNRSQTGHAARSGANAHRPGSRRCGSSSTTSSADPGEPSEPEPRLCLCGCGEDIGHLRADAEFLNDTHSKRYRREVRRQELRSPETTWAAADRRDLADWQILGDPRREPRIFRPDLTDDEVDPDGELQSLMEGYFYPGDEGEHLHPISELRPEKAKRKRLSGDWSWTSRKAVAA